MADHNAGNILPVPGDSDKKVERGKNATSLINHNQISRRLPFKDFHPSNGFFGRCKHDHATPDKEPEVPEVSNNVPWAIELILEPLLALAGVANLSDVTAVKEDPRSRQEVCSPTSCDKEYHHNK